MAPVNQGFTLLDAITIYFQGEKIEALVFILPIGLLCLVFGLWLLTDNPGNFAKGVAIPFLLMGMLMSSVGGSVGFRAASQVSEVVSSIQTDPSAAVQSELIRMTKVNAAWSLYLVMWGLFSVVGLVLRFLFASDFFQGVGIALVFIAGIGLLVDGFAERRTHPYVEALQDSALNLQSPR